VPSPPELDEADEEAVGVALAEVVALGTVAVVSGSAWVLLVSVSVVLVASTLSVLVW
jgi:hypothetical protein